MTVEGGGAIVEALVMVLESKSGSGKVLKVYRLRDALAGCRMAITGGFCGEIVRGNGCERDSFEQRTALVVVLPQVRQ